MPVRDFQAQDAERQHLLRAQLPQRLTRLRQRGERLRPGYWDINELYLLAEDAARLAGACDAANVGELAACLDSLGETITALLHPPHLPDHATAARIAKLIETLAQQRLPDAVASAARGGASVTIEGPTHASGFPLLVVPPAEYWTRLATAAPARHAYADLAATPAFAGARSAPNGGAHAAAVASAPAPHTHRVEAGADRPSSIESLAGALCSHEHFMRRVSECLAMEDANVRAGGVLLFALEDAGPRRARLGETRCDVLLGEVGDFLITHAGRLDVMAGAAGDGFLLFNPDCDPGVLEAYALNLRDRVARESFAADSAHRVVFDVGVCPFVAGATHADAMHEAALDAIETARAAGRHGVFTVRQVEPAIDAGLVQRIRFALDGSGFQLLFQPIVSLRGEEEEQFQVLLRLQGDDQRLHTAAEVIPAAKRAGLIGAVDRWVLEHCIRLIGSRMRDGRSPRLFVSQSLDSVRNPDSPAWLRDRLEQHRIAGDAVSIELHAGDATRALAEVRRYALAMKDFGTSLTLSGFEAGASGDHLMRALPADFIKIAPRYLRLDDAATRSELHALVERAQESGKRVIAPRVEDARGAAALWAVGIDFIQGNFVQEADAELAFDFQAAVM